MLVLSVSGSAAAQTQAARTQIDPATIMARSVEANNADWAAAPGYECFEEDQGKHGAETYDDKLIAGSPYQELIAVQGKPLTADMQRREQEKLERVVAQRKHESPARRAKRTARYLRERTRDHLMLAQLTKAFTFKLLSEDQLRGHRVYVLQAVPRPGYKPPKAEAGVLTGMQGKLWIDTASFQWVKVEAEVIHPVTIYGFLAKVEPGTSFELEKSPVGNAIWLPQHFTVHSSAKVLSLFPRKGRQEQTYSECQRATDSSAASAAAK